MEGAPVNGLVDLGGPNADPGAACLPSKGGSSQGWNAMGSNRREVEGASTAVETGNYLVHEKLYVPKAGQPCWDVALGSPTHTAEGDIYGWARYGFERPTSTGVDDDAWRFETNCTSWNRIQVDFDTREAAIRNNMLFAINDRKAAVIIPLYLYLAMLDPLPWPLPDIDYGGFEASVFVVGISNGLAGIADVAMPLGMPATNGCWVKGKVSTGLCMPHFGGNMTQLRLDDAYLIKEAVPMNGAGWTFSAKMNSFVSGEFFLLVDLTLRDFGLADTLGLIAIFDLDSLVTKILGNDPIMPEMLAKNMDPILGMANNVYEMRHLMTNPGTCSNGTDFDPVACALSAATWTPGDDTLADFNKFAKFYLQYYADDKTGGSTGTPGSNGIADVFEDWQAAKVLPGNMGPVPRVNGVSYPDVDGTGAIIGWTIYNGDSEGKFDGLLTLLTMAIGTIHEDGPVVTDSAGIRWYGDQFAPPAAQTGFRTQVDSMLNMMSAANDLKRGPDGDLNDSRPYTVLSQIYPVYDGSAMLLSLVENSPGARDGFLPWMLTHKYLDLNYLDPVKGDVETFISNSIRTLLNNTVLANDTPLAGATVPGVTNGELFAAKDKWRYFWTSNVLTDFPPGASNPATPDDPFPAGNFLTAIGGEPIDQLKAFFAYIRTLTNDAEIVTAFKKGIDAMNRYYAVKGLTGGVNLTYEDVDDIVGFMNAKNTDGDYTIDSVLDFMVQEGLHDVDTIRTFKFDNFSDLQAAKTELEDLNQKILDNFDIDVKKNIILSSGMQGEPFVDDGVPVGTAGNGRWDYQDSGLTEPSYAGNGQWDYDDVTLIAAFPAWKDNKKWDYDDANGNNCYDAGETAEAHEPAEAFYDHNKDGAFDRGVLSFREFEATQTYDNMMTNLGGTGVAVALPSMLVPDIYNLHGYDLRMDTAMESMREGMTDFSRADLDQGIIDFFATDVQQDLKGLVEDMLNDVYDDIYFDEPSNDRNGNGTIDIGDTITTDVDGDCIYDKDDGDTYTDDYPFGGNGKYDPPEFVDVNCDQRYTLKTDPGEAFIDNNKNKRRDVGELYVDLNNDGAWNPGEPFHDAKFSDGTRDGMQNPVQTPHADYPEPYTDSNGDGRFNGRITGRGIAAYYIRAYKDFYDGLIGPPNKIKVMVEAFDDLFNPASTQYVTASLISARQRFFDSANWEPEQLMALKNVIGGVFCDRNVVKKPGDLCAYTYTMSNVSVHLPSIMRQFQNQYNVMLDATIEGFKPDHFFSFMTSEMYPQKPYRGIDILTELKYLVNQEYVVCYPGKPGCENKTKYQMFWPSMSELLGIFGELAYKQHNLDFLDPNQYYGRFAGVIKKPQ